MLPLIRLIMTLALSLINFVVMLAPFYILALPFVLHDHVRLRNSIIILAASALVIMSLYLFLDMLFGFSVRRYRKKAIPVRREDELYTVFDEVKKAFGENGARLFYIQSEDINAYAVSVFFRKYVFISTGLVNLMRFRFADPRDQRLALKGILAHEVSHLSNGDSIAPHLINSNLYAIDRVDKFLASVYGFLAKILSAIPVVGFIVASVIWTLFIALRRFMGFLMKHVIFPLHTLASRMIGRAAEYRCDLDGANLVGSAMPLALSALPDGACDSVFSTHPSIKSRVQRLSGFTVPVRDASAVIPRRLNVEKLFVSLFMLGFFALVVLAVTLYLKGYRI